MSRRSKQYSRAFTLIELLISLSVVVIVIFILSRTSMDNLKIMKRFQRSFDHFHVSNMLVHMITSDLENCVSLNDDGGGSFKGKKRSIDFVVLRSPLKKKKTSNLTFVSYRVENMKVIRIETPIVRKDGGFYQSTKNKVSLCNGVRDLNFEYYSVKDEKWRKNWISKHELPVAVGFNMKILKQKGRSFSKISGQLVIPNQNSL